MSVLIPQPLPNASLEIMYMLPLSWDAYRINTMLSKLQNLRRLMLKAQTFVDYCGTGDRHHVVDGRLTVYPPYIAIPQFINELHLQDLGYDSDVHTSTYANEGFARYQLLYAIGPAYGVKTLRWNIPYCDQPHNEEAFDLSPDGGNLLNCFSSLTHFSLVFDDTLEKDILRTLLSALSELDNCHTLELQYGPQGSNGFPVDWPELASNVRTIRLPIGCVHHAIMTTKKHHAMKFEAMIDPEDLSERIKTMNREFYWSIEKMRRRCEKIGGRMTTDTSDKRELSIVYGDILDADMQSIYYDEDTCDGWFTVMRSSILGH